MGKKKNAKLTRRGVEAAARYLDRRGCETIEEGVGEDRSCIVAKDGETLVFAKVEIRDEMPSRNLPDTSRAILERVAIDHLSTQDIETGPVRFDEIVMVVIGEDKAFIRHHRNAFSTWSQASSA